MIEVVFYFFKLRRKSAVNNTAVPNLEDQPS